MTVERLLQAHCLKPFLVDDILEMTIPDKPNSRLQNTD